jgi:glycosyltransferase 2 family protein
MPRMRYAIGGMLLLGFTAIFLIIYSIGWQEITTVLRQASPLFLACYIVTSILIAGVLTFKWKLILKTQGIDVPYHRLFSYRMVGYSVSYLTPTAHVGGEPVRAYLLKREDVPVNTAFSTVIIDKSIELMADILFFFIGALLLINSVAVTGGTKIVLLTLSLILILLMGMFIGGILGKKSMFVTMFRFLRLNSFKKLKPVEKNLAQVEKQIERFYRKEKRMFLIIMLLMALLWVLMFFEYRFVLLMLGQKASPAQIFLILTGVGLAYTVPIPAAMGTLELGQLSAAKVLRLSSATGIALAFIIRARDLVWTAFGLITLMTHHFNFMKLSKQTRQIDKEFEQGELFKRR